MASRLFSVTSREGPAPPTTSLTLDLYSTCIDTCNGRAQYAVTRNYLGYHLNERLVIGDKFA
jgi:hypothetical protein